jgi:DNA relaxase NicK
VIIPYAVAEARVDWLTLTRTGTPRDKALLRLGQSLLTDPSNLPSTLKAWAWRGYIGEHAGGVTVGTREDSDILQLSSELAETWFDSAAGLATRCSRVDLCVTVVCNDGSMDHAQDAYRRGIEEVARDATAAVRSIITTTDGGATCYLGKRSSDLFGRIYDKRAESGDERYDRCWRWEVEIKGGPASATLDVLRLSADRRSAVISFVCGYYRRRNSGASWMEHYADLPISTLRPASTTDSRLIWLRKAVRPVVLRLTALGYGREVLAALGQDENLEERWRRRDRAVDNHYDELQDPSPGDYTGGRNA